MPLYSERLHDNDIANMNNICASDATGASGYKPSSRLTRLVSAGAVLMAVIFTAGCASTPHQFEGAQLVEVAPMVARPDGSVRVDTDNQQVAKLWAAAEKARAENKLTIAIELLYEALELDPQNSLLWSRAAEIKLDSVEPALAENYATRSNAWAGENRPLLYRNWLIIENARSMRGDLLGVRSANKQVQLYQYQ